MAMDAALGEMLAATARFFLALYLGLSALDKMRNMDRFVGNVAAYRLLPSCLSSIFSYLLVGAELVIASGLLLAGGLWPGTAAAALIGLFTIAIAINILRGHVDIDCGCHLSDRSDPLNWKLVLRNLALIVFALVAAGEGVAPILLKSSGAAAAATAFLLLLARQRLSGIAHIASRA